MIEKPKTRKPRKSPEDRGDATREKLLTTSIDVFGRYGFDGATTRMLSEAAGVNQQAIPYYFGGKEGLYIAAAEHIGSAISAHVSTLRERTRSRLAQADGIGVPIGQDEARGLLTEILQTIAALFVSRESEPWARFLIREQMEPTEAFKRVYGGVMKPMLEIVGRLVAVLLDEEPGSQHVRLRTLSLLGSVMVFRVAHAAVLAQLEWKSIGPEELAIVRGLARELVAAISPEGRNA
ncbi:CerR family C-terminal domain-containing protein [Mesorhizobium sp. RMAD-H1]|uniref:CerR family C-terminal domain-containing protein n=1 Tax=Mesorhizobium sp. RMAD-H1 TaxID=2587065 RepID=UPI001607B646|nr:CerR family C-terminal domain-containing protein [Mesorhizobium sp. RMAD-H1]MBB2974410.1 AcrR family transcriptional regulator [Mesorhizobium sp. RMAD-H1]